MAPGPQQQHRGRSNSDHRANNQQFEMDNGEEMDGEDEEDEEEFDEEELRNEFQMSNNKHLQQ